MALVPTPLLLLVTFKRLAMFAVLWLVLAGSSAAAVLAGAAVVPAVALVSLRLLPPDGQVRLLAVVRWIPGFLYRSLVGGIDVAMRAFRPKMPLNPGWLTVESHLPPGARAALGSEVTLMPGTLVAGSRGGAYLIHALDRDMPVTLAVRDEEARLAALISPGAGTAR